MSVLTQIINIQSETVITDGDSGWQPSGAVERLAVDLDVASLRGASTPGITFFVDREGQDGNGYPMYSPSEITSAGTLSQSIGPGLQTAILPSASTRLRWTLQGSSLSTTVGTGANSATQNLSSTAGMQAGDTLYFASAAVSAVISSVTDSTHVVLGSVVNSTSDETVTVTNTPCATFSASVIGR